MPNRPRSRKKATVSDRALDASSDAELVARCADGDDAAWRTLVNRYRRLIYTIPYRMGLDPADADEVFQVTFARLAERIGSLRDPERVRAWLVTTARRVALNLTGRRRDADPEALATIADTADLPEAEIERLQEQQLVRRALDGLGGRCRELLRRLYYPDPASGETGSYESVARELGVPVGSIGPTRMRCLKKLLLEYRRLTQDES